MDTYNTIVRHVILYYSCVLNMKMIYLSTIPKAFNKNEKIKLHYATCLQRAQPGQGDAKSFGMFQGQRGSVCAIPAYVNQHTLVEHCLGCFGFCGLRSVMHFVPTVTFSCIILRYITYIIIFLLTSAK